MKFIEQLQYTADVDKKRNAVKWLKYIVNPNGDGIPHDNVAKELNEDELNKIGQKVLREYEIDKSSRSEWEDNNKEAMRLARLVMEEKNDPWPGAASVKYPLITVAAIQFAARCYPEIIKGNMPVKYNIIGRDDTGEKTKRGQRIAAHMSYQILYEMDDWEVDFDRLLHVLPVIGICFRKTYFCPVEKKNVSQLCLPEDVIVHYNAENMRKVRRITHVVNYYQNDVFERIASGRWLDVEINIDSNDETPSETEIVNSFLEQHRFLDLDGDGYAEPYIVTVHENSGKVVRIVPRFEEKGIITNTKGELVSVIPNQYFVKYGFIPSPDGSIYDMGFGSLLYPLNETINSIINRLLDAGTLSNLQSGWIDRSLRERGGILAFKPGEWKKTDTSSMMGNLRDKILPLPTKEPSNVLFLMLQLLIEAGKEISSIKDILTGTQIGANVPATTILAMIEQGLKVFSAIYKRIYRSFSEELRQLARLNGIYLDKEHYFNVIDSKDAIQIGVDDYNFEDMDVMPTADPSISTEVQRLAKAQFLLSGVSGRPNVNEDEITIRAIDAADIPDKDKLMLPPQQPQPDPLLLVEHDKIEIEKQKLELEEMRLELDAHMKAAQLDEIAAKITKLQAEATKSLADAEAAEVGPQLQAYLTEIKGIFDTTKERIKAASQLRAAKQKGIEGNGNNKGNATELEEGRSNQGNYEQMQGI